MKWEILIQEKNGGLSRIRVYRGWIVNSLAVIDGIPALSSVFVPDNRDDWRIKDEL